MGLFSWIGGIFQRDQQRKAEKEALSNQNKLLETKKQNIKNQLGRDLNELTLGFNQAKQNYNNQIGANLSLRGIESGYASIANVKSSQMAMKQYQELSAVAKSSVGQAVQKSALSGFRGSGSVLNASKLQESSTERQLELARDQMQLQNLQSFQNARMNYINRTNQIESYQTALQQAEESYNLRKENITAIANENIADIDTQIDYNKQQYDYLDNGWNFVLDEIFYGLGAAEEEAYRIAGFFV